MHNALCKHVDCLPSIIIVQDVISADITSLGVCKQWTGLLEWITGLIFDLKITPKESLFTSKACSRKCK